MKSVLLSALTSSQDFRFDNHRPFKKYQGGSIVRELLDKEIKACENGDCDKRSRSVVAVVSGMGNGKSRLLDEMKSICFDVEKEIVYCLFCEFENGTGIPELRSGTDIRDIQERAHKEILDRIVFFLMKGVTGGPCPVGENSFTTYQKRYRWSFALQDLIIAIRVVAPNAITMVLVDGAHRMDLPHKKTVDFSALYETSYMRQVFVVLSNAVLCAPRVFAACSSPTSLLLRKTAADSPYVAKLLVTPPAMTTMPEEIQNSLVLEHGDALIQLFGRHPRTLEFLVKNTSSTLADIFASAGVAILRDYCLNEVGTDVVVPLLQRTLTGDGRFRLEEEIGGLTCDYLARLGLVKIHPSDLNHCQLTGRYRLHISALLMLFMRNHRDPSVLSAWRPYYEGADALEQFAASVRCIRSQVCEDNITLKDLHAGARWLKGGDTKVMKMPMQLAESSKQISTRGCDKAARKTTKQHPPTPGKWEVELSTQPIEGETQTLTTSSGDIGKYTILNARSAPAGDFFCRPKRSNGEHFNEVAQCKSKGLKTEGNRAVPLSDEMEKCASRGDTFIMISQCPMTDENIPEGIDCAVVGPDNFHAYYGPLSGTVVLDPPPSSQGIAEEGMWAQLWNMLYGK